MQATVLSSTLQGIDGLLVEVEVDLGLGGLARFADRRPGRPAR